MFGWHKYLLSDTQSLHFNQSYHSSVLGSVTIG